MRVDTGNPRKLLSLCAGTSPQTVSKCYYNFHMAGTQYTGKVRLLLQDRRTSQEYQQFVTKLCTQHQYPSYAGFENQ